MSLSRLAITHEPSQECCHLIQTFPSPPTRVSQFNFLYQEFYHLDRRPTTNRVFHIIADSNETKVRNDTELPIELHYCQIHHQFLLPPNQALTIKETKFQPGQYKINQPQHIYVLAERFSVTYRKAQSIVPLDRTLEFFVSPDIYYPDNCFHNRTSYNARVTVITKTHVDYLGPRRKIIRPAPNK